MGQYSDFWVSSQNPSSRVLVVNNPPGHRSIVNNCVFHPHLPQIVTSGVERHLTIHSPTLVAPNMEFQQTDTNVRALPELTPELDRRFVRALIEGHGLEEGQEAEAEQRTIDFFDG